MGPQLIALRRAAPRPAPAVDVDALEQPCAGACRAKCASPPAIRALYATDGSNYRQVPIGVVDSAHTSTTSSPPSKCAASTARRCCRAAAARSLAGQCCNVAVVIDFVEVPARVLELDAAARRARVEPGCVLDDLRNAARKHAPHLRARSVDARSLHARRHDRQQLLRRALGDGRAHRRQRRSSSRSSPTTACACASAPRRRRARARSSRDGGRARRDLPRPARAPRPLRAPHPRALSRTSRAASPATPSTSCCPRTASTWRARWSAPKAPA